MSFDQDSSEATFQIGECLEEIKKLKAENLQASHRQYMADGVLVLLESLQSEWRTTQADGKGFDVLCYALWPRVMERLARWQQYKHDASRGVVGEQMVLLDRDELAAGMKVTSQFKIEQDYGDGTLLIRKVVE